MKRRCPEQPSSSNLTCFLAFCESDANSIDNSGIINPELFGNYIPLKRTPETAVLAALAGRTIHAMKAANEATSWLVIELAWTPEQVGHLFVENKLCRSRELDGTVCWRLRERVLLHELAVVQWSVVELEATGLEAWAQRALRDCALRICACAECRGEMLLCRQGGHRRDSWCPPCWHRHLTERASADLHRAWQDRA
jgi:hypothetical protein